MIVTDYAALVWSTFYFTSLTFQIFEVQTYQMSFGKHAKTLTAKASAVTGSIKLPQYPVWYDNKYLVSPSVSLCTYLESNLNNLVLKLYTPLIYAALGTSHFVWWADRLLELMNAEGTKHDWLIGGFFTLTLQE